MFKKCKNKKTASEKLNNIFHTQSPLISGGSRWGAKCAVISIFRRIATVGLWVSEFNNKAIALMA